MSRAEDASPHPVLLALPYLPLREPIEFDGWWVGPLDQYEGPWIPPEFEGAARTFLGKCLGPDRSRIQSPALLARRDRGPNGQGLSRDEREALAITLGFSTIAANPPWSATGMTDAMRISTSDNATLIAQPIDLHNHWVTLGSGGRVATLSGGLKYTDSGFSVPSPLELHLPFPIKLDSGLAAALHRTLQKPPVGSEEVARSIRIAIPWLLKAWHNTPSILWEDRLVFLKTATEALTKGSQGPTAARALSALFRSALDSVRNFGARKLLWRSDDPEYCRTYKSGADIRTMDLPAFEHWFLAFCDARNAIVHGDGEVALSYTEAGSRYNGPFVQAAGRVVLEAVLALLGRCGHAILWCSEPERATYEAALRFEERQGGSSSLSAGE